MSISTKLWAIGLARKSTSIRILREDILPVMSKDGISPNTVRTELKARYGSGPVLFRLTGRVNDLPITQPQITYDFNVWSWIPIFSLRAKELIVNAGGVEEDFVHCLFESNPNERFFLHLPAQCYDVVDVPASQFIMMIPSDPPLPHGIEKLVLRENCVPFPSSFRACVPAHRQVFSELMFSDELRNAWNEANLTGAEFRLLT